MFNKQKTEAIIRPSSGFWSRQRIEERQKTDTLFWLPGPAPHYPAQDYDFDTENRLRAASYNLLMGSEAYVTPVDESDMRSVRILKDGEGFIIPPGQFAFLLTHEAVHVPADAFAFLALRAKALKFQGLLNVSGFHIDPGYNGRLVLAVYKCRTRPDSPAAGAAAVRGVFRRSRSTQQQTLCEPDLQDRARLHQPNRRAV